MQTAKFIILCAGAAVLASCGGPDQPPPEKPRSVAALLAEAKRCEKEAAEHDAMARDPEAMRPPDQCVNPVDDVSTSGGKPLVERRPCWTGLAPPSQHHRREADKLRREAAEYRRQAGALLHMEQEACAGLSQADIDYSPFFRRPDILKIEPFMVAGELRGAQVWFRKVPGLTVEWMQHATQCHIARGAVMGHTDSFQPYCPLVLEGISARVEDTPEGILVVVRAESDDVAPVVLGRAQDACGPTLPPPSEDGGDADAPADPVSPEAEPATSGQP
ncbi:hypothetical protein [Haliangium sp.]|uniref:hypothetical protein n=1 Tax=Haliangium sp. TaxID=2663208 RepID=UPI003D0CCC64